VSSPGIGARRIAPAQSQKTLIMTAHRWRLSEFLILERLRVVPFHGLPFFSSSKCRAQVSSALPMWDRKVSSSAFFSVLCSTVRL